MIYGILQGIHSAVDPYFFVWNDKAEKTAKKALAVLNMVTNTTGGSLIAGDGEVDLWYGNRRTYGFQIAGNAALAGRKEKLSMLLKRWLLLRKSFIPCRKEPC